METTIIYKPNESEYFICKQCHHQLSNGDTKPDFKFCPYCGTPVRQDNNDDGKVFAVTYGIEGKYTIDVTASSIKDAVAKADASFDKINPGDIYLTHHQVQKVTEEYNTTTYF